MERETEILVGQKWLLIAGVVMTLFGMGFFLKYSFDHNWITPSARIVMAYLGSFLFLIVGEYTRKQKHEGFGLYLIGASVVAFYLTTYGAYSLYHFFDLALVFILMIFITLLAGLLALRSNSQALAVIGTIGGFVTPLLLETGMNDFVLFLSYLCMLNVGVLFISFFKQWKALNILGFVFTWILFTSWFVPNYHKDLFLPAIFFLNLFFAIYEFVPFAIYFARKENETAPGFLITIPNTLIAFAYSFSMIRELYIRETVAYVTSAYALVFLSLSWLLSQKNPSNKEALLLLMAKTLFFAILTVPILFSKNWITIFWSLQALMLVGLSRRTTFQWFYKLGFILMTLCACKFIFWDYPWVFHFNFDVLGFSSGYLAQSPDRLITGATIVFSLLFISQWIAETTALQGKFGENLVIVYGLLIGFAFLVLNIEVCGFYADFAPRGQFAAISVFWALFATALMALGFFKRVVGLRVASIVLFTATLMKVFFCDLTSASTPFRIISSIVLGLLLIGASYLYHHFTDRLMTKVPSIPASERK